MTRRSAAPRIPVPLAALALALVRLATLPARAFALPPGGPSRPPVKGCAWEKVADAGAGLEAWVQRCDFGFRKIDLFVQGKSLFVRYSDGGAPDPLVDVLDLLPGETPEAGVSRVFREHTSKELAGRCVLAPYRNAKAPPGTRFLTFEPDAKFQKELDRKRDPNEVPDPPCGDWGDAPDGIQYFQVFPRSPVRRFLFVRVGQDEPLFDDKTLRILASQAR